MVAHRSQSKKVKKTTNKKILKNDQKNIYIYIYSEKNKITMTHECKI